MQDKQVPAEIKARLSRLQFPVLKAALVDAAFFASSAHPARKLIDRIAGTSTGWEPYGDDNQNYLKEDDRVVAEILKSFETDLGVFDVTPDGLKGAELAPGVTVEEIRLKTGCHVHLSHLNMPA